MDKPTDPELQLPGHGQTPSLAPVVDDGWRDADPWPMDPVSRAALRGVVAALCPSPETGALDTPPLADVQGQVCAAVRCTLRYLEWPMAVGLHMGLLVLDWSPLWRLHSLKPLHSLAPAQAAAIMDELAVSRLSLLRNLVMGARASVLMQWYDLPQIHALLNYDPVTHMRERIDLRRRLLAGEQATEADMLRPSIDELPGGGP